MCRIEPALIGMDHAASEQRPALGVGVGVGHNSRQARGVVAVLPRHIPLAQPAVGHGAHAERIDLRETILLRDRALQRLFRNTHARGNIIAF
jgi:hypothetical protein